jgi:tetratricopeptide (TPR) repeat protein
MKIAVLLTAMCVAVPSMTSIAGAQAARAPSPQSGATPPAKVAQAYEQFLIGHHLEENEDLPGAIAAYKKAMELDPLAADIPAELAGLYFRHERIDEAVSAAEQALKIAPANPEAHRVLGLIAASKVDGRPRQQQGAADDDSAKAIQHLEKAIANPIGDADENARGTLAKLYLRIAAYDKAIALLVDLVRQLPGWTDGPRLLAQAYAGAGRTADAIALLDEQASDDPSLLPTLADFYERQQRWKDAANAYARALNVAPRNVELKTRYAQALMNAGGRDNLGKARDALNDIVSTRNDARALYLLSQADRRFGDLRGAEAAARRVIALQDQSPWGYLALAEALGDSRQYTRIVDALTPAIAKFQALSGDHSVELRMLLPHLGFALQELGEYEQALTTFDQAHRLSPKDALITSYLIDANISSRKYGAALQLARQARAENPGDLTLARLEAQALRLDGKPDMGVAVLEEALKNHAEEPAAYVALAQIYQDVSRGPQAVKLLQDAQRKFPSSISIPFQLGAVFDKQKNFAAAETAFRQVLEREPDNAGALNYLGYMLAERGERLEESVGYLKRALEKEPDNGSFLDSLGWAYFKAGKLDLAEENLRRAAEQLKANSVIQEHYGQLLFKVGRYEDAIAAWNRALAGDGASIDRAEIDKKIRDAREKLNKR